MATAPVAGAAAPRASATVELVVAGAGIRLLDAPTSGGRAAWWSRRSTGPTASGCSARSCSGYPDDVPQTPVSVLVPAVGPPSAPAHGGRRPGPDAATVASLDRLTAPGGRLRGLRRRWPPTRTSGVVVDPRPVVPTPRRAARRPGRGPTDLADGCAGTTSSRSRGRTPTSPRLAHAEHADLRPAWPSTDGPDRDPRPHAPSDGLLWSPGDELPDQTTAAVTSQVGADLLVLPPRTDAEARETARRPRVRAHDHGRRSTTLGPDGTLTRLLADPQDVDPGATTATTVQRALAELAVISRESGRPAALLLAPDRAWVPDLADVTALVAALQSAPWVRVDPGRRAAGRGATTRRRPRCRRTRSAATSSRRRSVRALADARDRAVAFSSVTSEPELLLDGVDTRCSRRCPSRGARTPRAATPWSRRRSSPTSTRAPRACPSPPLSDISVLAASDSELPVVVRNELAVPATVVLEVTPAQGVPARSATSTR